MQLTDHQVSNSYCTFIFPETYTLVGPTLGASCG
jgi:hypothetical protein